MHASKTWKELPGLSQILSKLYILRNDACMHGCMRGHVSMHTAYMHVTSCIYVICILHMHFEASENDPALGAPRWYIRCSTRSNFALRAGFMAPLRPKKQKAWNRKSYGAKRYMRHPNLPWKWCCTHITCHVISRTPTQPTINARPAKSERLGHLWRGSLAGARIAWANPRRPWGRMPWWGLSSMN